MPAAISYQKVKQSEISENQSPKFQRIKVPKFRENLTNTDKINHTVHNSNTSQVRFLMSDQIKIVLTLKAFIDSQKRKRIDKDIDLHGGLSSAKPTRVLHVPSEHSTLQAAVDVAQAGERVMLAPGVYNGRVRIHNKHVDIVGMGGGGSVVLEYTGDGNVVSIKGVAANVSLSNLTIRHRGGTTQNKIFGAILLIGGSKVQVEGCDLNSQAGGGVYAMQEGTDLRLKCCTVHDCTHSGIMISSGATATVEDCTSHNNVMSGIQLQDGSTATLRRNTCHSNHYGICIIELDGEDPINAVVENNQLDVPGSCNDRGDLEISQACHDRVLQRHNTVHTTHLL